MKKKCIHKQFQTGWKQMKKKKIENFSKEMESLS